MRDSMYEKFFALREKFPQHTALIASLMAQYFSNHECFPHYFCILGKYSEKDLQDIFSELGVTNFIASKEGSVIRPPQCQTNIFFFDETKSAD